MKIFTIILFSFLIQIFTVLAQNPKMHWVKQIGGETGEHPASITVDASGNIYTIGYFIGIFDCDPSDGTTFLSSPDSLGMYIAKFGESGNFIWAKSIAGTGYIYANSIVLDKSGNPYITGYFTGSADFDPSDSVLILSNSTNDNESIFISKFDTTGNVVWAKSVEGSRLATRGNAIALDKSDNVYITGVFAGLADFNPGEGVFNLNRNGGTNLFVLKLDSFGNFIWVKQFESTGNFEANSSFGIAVDGSANVFTTGYFTSTTDFDPGHSKYYKTPKAEGSCSSFISKLDSLGNFVSVACFSGLEFSTYGFAITVDSVGNVYATGSFYSKTDFDPGPDSLFLTPTGVPGNYPDIYLVKWDSSGKVPWAKKIGGTAQDAPQSIAIDKSGNVYTSGYFSGTVDFDPGPKVRPLQTGIYSNAYVSKLDSKGNYVWALQLGRSGTNYVCVDPSGSNVYVTGSLIGISDFDPSAADLYLACEGGSDIYIEKLNQTTVDVSEPEISGLLSLYPNPSANTIKVNFGKQLTNGRIKLINLFGQTVVEQTDVNCASFNLDIAEQTSGMYFLEVMEGGIVKRVKVVKE